MGWRCGLHADWTELTNGCVEDIMEGKNVTTGHDKVRDDHFDVQSDDSSIDDQNAIIPDHKPSLMTQQLSGQRKRRLFFITLLREPISRFISEWRHVQRGATWKSSIHKCGGKIPSDQQLPECYDGPDWMGVRLNEFISCKSNLAINRQTRMLSDLNLVGCYNNSYFGTNHEAIKRRDIMMLQSAKDNLKNMAYFGLCENQSVSQYLFESTFNLRFNKPFIQLNETHSSLALKGIDDDVLIKKINELNQLDVELYDYAKGLMYQRFEMMKKSDPKFHDNFQRVTKMIESVDAIEEYEKRKVKIRYDEEKSSREELINSHFDGIH